MKPATQRRFIQIKGKWINELMDKTIRLIATNSPL